jgi:hypothetical protein
MDGYWVTGRLKSDNVPINTRIRETTMERTGRRINILNISYFFNKE